MAITIQTLQKAIKSKDLHTLQTLLNDWPDVNATDKSGKTLLHIAVEHNNLEAVDMLLTEAANPNLQDHQGKTPLHLASAKNIIDTLLKNGAEPSITDEKGRQALKSKPPLIKDQKMPVNVKKKASSLNAVHDAPETSPRFRASTERFIESWKKPAHPSTQEALSPNTQTLMKMVKEGKPSHKINNMILSNTDISINSRDKLNKTVLDYAHGLPFNHDERDNLIKALTVHGAKRGMELDEAQEHKAHKMKKLSKEFGSSHDLKSLNLTEAKEITAPKRKDKTDTERQK